LNFTQLILIDVSYAFVLLARLLGYIWGDRAATTFSGPNSLSVPVSLTLNAIGFVFLVFAVITFNFPSEAPVEKLSMNYTSAAIGVVALLSILTWITTGYKHFHGPVDVRKIGAETCQEVVSKRN
jgi:hypothetical protein